MRAAFTEREGPLRYPIEVTFAVCCASAASGVAKRPRAPRKARRSIIASPCADASARVPRDLAFGHRLFRTRRMAGGNLAWGSVARTASATERALATALEAGTLSGHFSAPAGYMRHTSSPL